MTQRERLYKLLKLRGDIGVYPTEFITEVGATQPLARVKELREQFKCTHINGNTVCTATEHIINKRIPNGHTKYFYTKTESPFTAYREQDKQIINKGRQSDQMSLI